MRLAAFDLEIAKEIPEAVENWLSVAPPGISCAAVALSDDQGRPHLWQGVPRMTQQECRSMVRDLQGLASDGYTFLTWNGCGFDFAVLAMESGMYTECTELALNHVDLMLRVTFEKGWYLSFQKALRGARLEGKLQSVTLSDGTVLDGMDGSKVPKLWAACEYAAVLDYLRNDVVQLLRLAHAIQRTKVIRWTSDRGNPQQVFVERMLTVRECFDIPEPDVSWMKDPPTRQQFVQWMRPSPTVDKSAPARMLTTRFRAGDRVRHSRFGEGMVLSSKLLGDDEEVTVVFEDVGAKRCLTSFADMEKL
ncbi:MAG: hypothetical protein CEE40_05345 [Chloroflexi bacterium B3_Chlor]|nr:MAG: hypothetical protein CEE40_05345 [Chloroflexi bacterium B3_Chlor]